MSFETRQSVRIRCKSCGHVRRKSIQATRVGWVLFCARCNEYTTEKEAVEAHQKEKE